jgi:hypothetical protein
VLSSFHRSRYWFKFRGASVVLFNQGCTKDARGPSLKNVSSLVSSITDQDYDNQAPVRPADFFWFGGSALPRKVETIRVALRIRRASHIVVNCFSRVDGQGVLTVVRPAKRPIGFQVVRGHVVRRIDAGHVNQAFGATVLFLSLPRDTVSIDLCFFVIRSIQDRDKLVLRSYLSSESRSVIFTCASRLPSSGCNIQDRSVLIRRNCFFSLLFDALRSLAPSRDALYGRTYRQTLANNAKNNTVDRSGDQASINVPPTCIGALAHCTTTLLAGQWYWRQVGCAGTHRCLYLYITPSSIDYLL